VCGFEAAAGMESKRPDGLESKMPASDPFGCAQARSERYNCKGGCTTDAAWRGLRRRTLKRTLHGLGVRILHGVERPFWTSSGGY